MREESRAAQCAALVLAALIAAAALTGCSGFRLSHISTGIAPDVRAAHGLAPGEATLQECLTLLGAPVSVETDQQGGGRVLTWEWEHVHGWGFFFSLPLSELISASLNYDRLGRDPDRLRLVFDESWLLIDRVED